MRTLRLVIAYDGTAFHGWQSQPRLRTVQGVVEEALGAVLTAEVRLSGAGRTDAGVHARGQVASLETDSTLPGPAIVALANRRLPGDVRIRSAREAPAGFHARRSARARRYAYRILEGEDLLMERFAWNGRRPLRMDRLDAATRALEGEADFAAFRSTGSAPTSTRCHVHRARWERLRSGARLDIVADHFLYHMVRTIVGTSLSAAETSDPPGAMRRVLESGDRRRAGVVAPAAGLCLERVYYADEEGA